VVLVMAQTSQDRDLDPSLDLVQDLILELIDQDQLQNLDLDQGLGQDLDQDPGPDLHPDIHSLTINLVLGQILGQEGQTKRRNLMPVDNPKDLVRQQVMLVIEALEVKKVRSYSRLVKGKRPQKCSQLFQTIQILKMKIKCQNRNRRKYQKRKKRILQI